MEESTITRVDCTSVKPGRMWTRPAHALLKSLCLNLQPFGGKAWYFATCGCGKTTSTEI